MEEVNDDPITIEDTPKKSEGEKKTFELIPEDMYEAEYTGYRKEPWTHKEWGAKMKLRLFFKIVSGPLKDRQTSYSENMHRNKETGRFYVGSDTDLAKAIKAITRGDVALNDTYKGNKVRILVTHTQSKDKTKTWDFATKVMLPLENAATSAASVFEPAAAKPSNGASAKAEPAAKPAAKPAASAAAKPADQPKASASSELLDQLTELGDFKV